MSPRFAFLAGLLASLPVAGMDISGIILNKNDQPVPLAQVCLRNSPSRCVASTINGTFRIADGSGVRLDEALRGYSLEILGNRMTLTAPGALRARLGWHDLSGRAVAPVQEVDLAAGENILAMPTLPREGVHVVRLIADGFTLAWKAVLLEGRLRGSADGGRGKSPHALSKASAAISDLVVTKTGFRQEIYRPSREVEVDAVVVLTANSDSGLVFTSAYKARNTLDRSKGEWITEASFDTCDGANAVKATVKDTGRFAVRDGKLYQYDEGQCRGETFTGGGADVVGTWTMAEGDVFLPQDLRPASCRDTVLPSLVPPTLKGRLTITEAEQTFEITAEVCPPDLYLGLIAFYLLTDTTVELASNTCRRLGFRKGDGEEATLSFAKRGDSLASTFSHKTTVCSGAEMMREGEGVAIDCKSPDPVLGFLECIAATGYFGAPPPRASLAKAAAPRARLAPPQPPRLPAGFRPGPVQAIPRPAGRGVIFPLHGRP